MIYKNDLTIAIPNYNGGINLKRAIESIDNLDLKHLDYEILVTDNCSTDNSVNIVTSLSQKDSRIRLIKNKKNIGRIGNWNLCLNKSRGKYLLFLMTNDYFLNFALL